MRKQTIILTIIMLIGLTINSCKKDVSCAKEIPKWYHLVDLSTNYDPVCGCDGNTYQNSAHAECEGITDYKKGKCKW